MGSQDNPYGEIFSFFSKIAVIETFIYLKNNLKTMKQKNPKKIRKKFSFLPYGRGAPFFAGGFASHLGLETVKGDTE